MRHAPVALVTLLAAFAVIAPPARASCSSPYLIVTNATVQSNPDWCGGYGCYANEGGPAVGGDVVATFWALGAGNPAIGQGSDSGALLQDQWFHPLNPPGTFGNGTYYYRVTFSTNWGADPAIDGCVTSAGPPGDNCTVIAFSDQFDDTGYFALLSKRSDPLGHFRFDRPGGAPFVLAPTPRPTVTGVTRLDPFTLLMTVASPEIPGEALFLDPEGCDTDVVIGYKIYYQQRPQGGSPPVDRRREQWLLAPGGAGPAGEPLPLGIGATIALSCDSQPLYFATSLVFDGGFELAHVSEQTGEILCDPFCVDLDADGWCEFSEVPEIPFDCNDANPDIHPYATEINDGIDNQCPGFPGFGLIDELSGRAGFFNPDLKTEFSWPSQPGATLYEIARSPLPDHSSDCLIDVTEDRVVDVVAVPDAGELFHLLTRAAAPHPGSWGATSAGVERLVSCP